MKKMTINVKISSVAMVSDNLEDDQTQYRHQIMYPITFIQYLQQSTSYVNYVVASIKKNNRPPANLSVSWMIDA